MVVTRLNEMQVCSMIYLPIEYCENTMYFVLVWILCIEYGVRSTLYGVFYFMKMEMPPYQK